ncbi:hypothetical protein DLAC_04626 [Tieghemostelium lacteum]|uniref:Transmembrane protein n=1 Tax=Tieghemostelium lacteum TaxID=361077 RepID=A0A151ZK94_TIELA|nr:hypothetical protein DLAC_04626 [Tieghemostelium lacteum]|eukprot:KYQ94329.1 hypothetical protein DLAC_04626 [Tieghemostelium lacteum]
MVHYLSQPGPQVGYIYQHQIPYGIWENPLSWSPQIVPGPTDSVYFENLGDYCIAIDNVLVGTIDLGTTTTPNISLELRASLVAQEVRILATGTLILNSSDPSSVVSISNTGAFYVFGIAEVYTILNITTGYAVGIGGLLETKPGSTLNINPPTLLSNTGYLSINGGSTHIHGVQCNGSIFIQNSNSIMDRISPLVGTLDILMNLNGTLALYNSVVNTTANYMVFYYLSGMVLTGGSTLNYQFPEFVRNVTFGKLMFDDSSAAYIENSVINLKGVKINLWWKSLFFLNSSTLHTDYSILIYENSEFDMVSGSQLIVTEYLVIADTAKLISYDSSIKVIDGSFGMYGDSKIQLIGSNLTIQVDNPDVGSVIGVLGSSRVYVYQKSYLNLDSIFLITGQSMVIASNESIVTVKKELLIAEGSRVLIEDGATVSIDASVGVTGLASLHTDKANVLINNHLVVEEQADFWFIDSNVTVSQSFLHSAQNYTSVITRSKFSVDGSFASLGFLEVVDSEIIVIDNFTTTSNLKCNTSKTFIESGNLFIFGYFESHNSNFTATNGYLQVSPFAVFKCYSCQIDIKAGGFTQGPFSDVTIVNSTFINRGGTVESSSPLKLTQSGITNKGNFILKSDISTDDNSGSFLVENQGDFIINGDNSSTINLKFNNNGGNLNINQNSNFEELQQEKGTILLNNFTLASGQVIKVNGGYLKGNGQINGQLINNGNLGDSENVNIIIINGNLTQSESSSTIAYVTDSENSHFNISENVSLNGTLKIRIEDTISDANQTKQIITTQSSNNTQFKKIQVVYYNKETKTEYPPCKPIETEQTEKGLAVLLKSGNQPNQNCDDGQSESKKSITIPLTVGLVVGVVGASILVASIFILKNRIGPRLFVRSIGEKLKRITTKH